MALVHVYVVGEFLEGNSGCNNVVREREPRCATKLSLVSEISISLSVSLCVMRRNDSPLWLSSTPSYLRSDHKTLISSMQTSPPFYSKLNYFCLGNSFLQAENFFGVIWEKNFAKLNHTEMQIVIVFHLFELGRRKKGVKRETSCREKEKVCMSCFMALKVLSTRDSSAVVFVLPKKY